MLALLAYATPVFWIGLMLIVAFAVKLAWFPVGGMPRSGGRASARRRTRRGAAPGAAGRDARALLHRALHPADARVDARGVRPGLRPHRARQGPDGAAGRVPPRRCATRAAGRHDARPADRHDARRRGGRRDGVRLARARPPRLRGGAAARLQRAARHRSSLIVVHGDRVNRWSTSPTALLDPRIELAMMRDVPNAPGRATRRPGACWRPGDPRAGRVAGARGPLAIPGRSVRHGRRAVPAAARPADSRSAPTRSAATAGRHHHGARVSLAGRLRRGAARGAHRHRLGAFAGYYGGAIDDAADARDRVVPDAAGFSSRWCWSRCFTPLDRPAHRPRSPSCRWPPWRGSCAASSCACAARVRAGLRVAGHASAPIIFTQILPNALPPMIVPATLVVARGDPDRGGLSLPRPRRSEPR